MKHIFVFVMITAFIGCTKEKRHHNSLIGKWKQVEVYINPGNGGSWQPDNSPSVTTIQFNADGGFQSNDNYFGNFNRYELSGDTIRFYPAMNGVIRFGWYKFVSDTKLQITYTCMEGCGSRFVKD